MTALGRRHLLVARDADTVRITMNRPERRNALSGEYLVELLAFLAKRPPVWRD
ncbi:hypothetical protein [Nocardia grenadensis]|uniref:hypothetical protein n=1 Tax=Nocardia grenadensis TaxID=931537 RepID=UPI003D940679